MDFQSLPRPVKTYHQKTYDRISPSKTKFDGAGKTILITGGATGVGYSISESFTEAGAEAKKSLTAKFPKTEIETVQASITDPDRMEEIIKQAGDIDVLVLCAANTHTAFSTIRVYLKQPTPTSKTIINISSAAAHMTLPQMAGYGPSKGAFSNILQAVAAEYPGENDPRIFQFHPGVFLTPMAKSVGFSVENVPEGFWEDIKLPGDFAVWCAGPESTFLHGRFVWAHWDVDELIALKARVEREPGFLQLGLVQ
ncbi:hypothetical protein M409DRAFT_71111 [Zasmidium cellare ATCC 36951]|uniref:NAD(P)-binding protein n=1 Tax=Zasmidium cellare ATCC 36951 TaxID=1080233 RepID=A0A6A6C0V3_ZASCE|nr:uncharacterized protein M409DRAFT_71111 [Zasmidium cellare ATCC 36951]KAF2159336.1 hypothetical protein M409DRAFT_71111 [Zasmidium cellare ATCC 36951]